jgi:hypothetical protein
MSISFKLHRVKPVLLLQEPPQRAQIVCQTVEGTGTGMSLTVTIGGQISRPFLNAVSYAPPYITGFDGPGAIDADANGGQIVNIYGYNFGPVDAWYVWLPVSRVNMRI